MKGCDVVHARGIRVNFQRAGREYRIPETTAYPAAEFIVAAQQVLTDPPVRFWQ